METQPIKIAVDQEMADIFKQPTGEDGNAEAYDLHMGILELSVSLRNINHDVEKSHGKDPEERTLHETRGDLFMRLYKELVDIEPDEIKRCEYLTFFYDLFESVKPKLSGLQESFTYRMELIDRMHGQVQCILERLSRTQNAKEISSASKVNIYLESKMVPNEVDTQSSSRIVGLNEEKCNRDKKVELRKVHTEKLHVEGFSVIESYREIINCPLKGIRFDDVITLVTYKNLRSEPKDPKPSKNDFQMESISPDVHENNFSIASHEDSAYISFMDRVFLSVNDSFACKETISSVEPVEKSIRNLESCSENNFVLVSSVFNEKGTDKNDELPKELKVSKSSLNKDLIFDRRDVENIVPFTIEKDRIGHKISINSEFKLYDSHSCPKTTQPFNYNTTATCSTKSSYKGACKIPIGIHSCNFPLKKSAGTLSGSKFDKPTQSNLEKMKDLFVDYKKKLDSINEVLEKQLPDTENKFKTLSEPEKMEADEKSTLQKKNLKSPTVSTKSEDQSLNQLRQAVSDIKMNILKEVDKSLELTHKNSSHILLSKPSREIAKNEPKNLFRNSRFTDVLRWQYPRNIYPPKDSVNKILQNKSCKSNYSSVSSKKVSSNANPRNMLDKPMSKLYKKNQTAPLHKEMAKCDDGSNDICNFETTPVKSEQYFVKEGYKEITEPILSEIRQSAGEFQQKVIKEEEASNCLLVENSRNKDMADQIVDPKDLSSSTHNLSIDICEACCDPDNLEMISPIFSQVNQTVRDVRLNVPNEIDNVLNEKDNVYTWVDGNSTQKVWVQNTEDLSPSSCTECCDLRISTDELNEFVGEENISPTLSQITQTSNLVKLHVLEKMDKFLSDISSINITIKDEDVEEDSLMLVGRHCQGSNEISPSSCNLSNNTLDEDVEEDTLMLVGRDIEGSKELSPSSCNLSTNTLEGFSDIGQRLTAGHPPDDQYKLSPILSQITQTVTDVKINILNEVDKSLSEITLGVSDILKNRESKEYFRKQHESQEIIYTTAESTLIDLSEESVVKVNPSKNVNTSISEAILGKQPPKNVSQKSETSELSECSEKQLSSKDSNQILYLCKNCNVKVDYSKEEDKYFAEGFCIKKRKCNVTEATSVESEFIRKSRPKWHHQRYVIAAPRVIIKSFKSNPAYEWVPDDPNAPDLYEQLDQFFEITGHKKYCAGCETITASIQAKLSQVLQRVIREAPEDVNFPDLITIVGKGKLEQLLTRKEKTVYESLRWQARDKGDQDLSAESLFTDALHGMMGYGSPHLKVSPLTGRLLLCSPQHQKSISESYLLLTVGHLGYFYRELKGHQVMLAEQGDTAVALRKCLQKYLLNFHQFYEAQKRNPCSLLSLYQSTRDFQLQFEWLLEVFNNVQKAKSAVVSLYEESRRRTGYQRNLLLKWLRVVIQPFIFNLYQWLLNGRLPSANLDKFLIEQTKSSKIEEFWQNRYCITEFFSGIFDPQLSEILISVGKTLKYSDKYLAINVETCLPRKELRCMLLETFDQFFRHGDQEPLYNFVRKLHLEISCKVLKHLRKIKTSPEHLFSELHRYIMLTDHEFTNEFLKMFEPILSDTESSFNIQLFNEMKDKMLHKPVPDIYIDKSQSEGSRCWSMLILRWKMPVHWKALLGGDSKEYEAIFSAMWRFHYVYYVLCERVHRQQMQFRNRIEFKYFEDLNETFKCFSKLINACMRLMSVLREYFFNHLLEPAFAKLLLACEHANTVDQLLDANRKYLRTIMFGSLQAKNLRKSHQYLGRLYDLILKLDDKQQKFLKLSQNSEDYVIKVRAHKPQSIVSNFYRERMLQFRWTCQNYSDVIKEMRDQFDLTMISFLFSLHLAADDSLRRLVKRLDPECYYMEKDNRLGLVQFFEFKRKTQKK